MTECKIEKKSDRNDWKWLLWWQIDKNELQKQVDQYQTLKFTQSAKGISILCLLFSAVITTIFVLFFNLDSSAFFDVFLFLILGFFIYKGHQWAMIGAMLLWTYEKLLFVVEQFQNTASTSSGTSKIIGSLIWWTIYMHAFYLAFQVERLRAKNKKEVFATDQSVSLTNINEKEPEVKIRNLDNKELLEILKHKNDYKNETIIIAENECKKRNIKVEDIKQQSLTLPSAKIPGYKTVKQSLSVVKTAIGLILLTDIVSLIICAYTGEYTLQDVGILFLDLFFCYHLLKMKEWARRWTIGRLIIGGIIYIPMYIYQKYILSVIWMGLFAITIIFLLSSKSSKRKTIVISVTYLVFLGGMSFYLGYNIFKGSKRISIINKMPAKIEYEYDKYIIKLPSNYWRVIDKDEAKSFIGESANDVTTFIATTDNAHYAKLVEDIYINDINSEKVKDHIRSTFKGVNFSDQKITENMVMLNGEYTKNGILGYFVVAYKRLETIGMSWYFWGPMDNFKNIYNDILYVIENTKEVSLKQRLAKTYPAEIFKKYSDALVLIRIYDKDGKITAFGSGINIAKEGVIITNLHIILAGKYIDVKFPNHGIYEDVYIAGLSKNSRDLVILKINGKDLPCIDKERSVDIEIGDKVTVISNPEGMLNSLSEGIVSGIRYDENNNILYQITAPISAGSSGGAVFNEFGELLGVCSSTIETGQNLNFYIPIEEINNFEIYEAKDMFALDQLVDYLENERQQEQTKQ